MPHDHYSYEDYCNDFAAFGDQAMDDYLYEMNAREDYNRELEAEHHDPYAAMEDAPDAFLDAAYEDRFECESDHDFF